MNTFHTMDYAVWLLPLLLSLVLLLPGRNAAGNGAQLALGDQLTVAMQRIEQNCLAECADQVSADIRRTWPAQSMAGENCPQPHAECCGCAVGAERVATFAYAPLLFCPLKSISFN